MAGLSFQRLGVVLKTATILACLCLGMVGHSDARNPEDLGRDNWPLASATWMITRPEPYAPGCEPGTAPTYIGPNMTLEVWTSKWDGQGGITTDVMVDELPVPASGYVRWIYPMRPGTREMVRVRTRQWYIRQPFTDPDTVTTWGCWSKWSWVEVPAWATRWGTIDDLPALPR